MSKIKSSKKAIAFVLTLLMIIGIGIPQISFATGELIKFEIVVDKDNVVVGEDFTYTILYSYSSNDSNFTGEAILFSLPEPLELVSFLGSADVKDYTKVEDLGGTSQPGIVINMKDLKAGTTGFLKVKAQFKPGSINEETSRAGILTNKPDAPLTASAIVPVVTANVDPVWTWSLKKERVLPSESITPARGGETTYRISVKGNNEVGGFPIENVVIKDTLPPGSDFVSATSDYNLSPAALSPTSLEWTIPYLSPGATKTMNVTVRYPETYTSNDAVNIADVSANRKDYSLNSATLRAINSHLISSPFPSVGTISKKSRQENDRYAVGQTVVYYINGYNNMGNVAIDEMEIVDTIPDGINLQSVTKGDANQVYYSTYSSPGNFKIWTTPSALPPDLGGDHIKKVKWVIYNAPVGFIGETIIIKGTLLEKYREEPLSPGAITTGQSITNTAILSATAGGISLTGSAASTTITVGTSGEMELPWLELSKFADNPPKVNKQIDKGETVNYTIRLKNNQFATGDLVLNPGDHITIKDFPDESVMTDYVFTTISGICSSIGSITSGSGLANGASGAAVTNVAWEWTGGMLKPGEYVDITYTMKVTDSALVGAYANTSTAIASIPLDIRTPTLSAVSKVFVRFSGSLKSSKGIKGPNDSSFIYPSPTAITDSYPGGTVRYQLKVNNGDSNGDITNVVMIDKFPFVGDKGVLTGADRDSKWSPFLINVVTGEDGKTLTSASIYYSTSENPDISKLSNYKAVDTGWFLTPPALITDVKAIKIEFGNTVFKPNGEEIYVEWDMGIPVSFNEEDYGKIAYNSFAYGATFTEYDISGTAIDKNFIPAEPRMVGAKVAKTTTEAITTYAIGNFIWEDENKDGVQGASETGVNGINVKLYKTDDLSFFRETYTINSFDGKPGYYAFIGLTPGAYTVEFVMPNGYFITDYKTTGEAFDSDFKLSGAGVYVATVTLGAIDNLDIDAGIYRLGSIGDKVFNDRNFNDKQDTGIDVGVSGASVRLYVTANGITSDALYWNPTSAAFVTTSTIYTTSLGAYNFTGLAPGKYIVEFTMPSKDFIFVNPTTAGVGIDSDVILTGTAVSGATVGWTSEIELTSGAVRTDIDAGIRLGQIGDRVWHDKNGNGIQDDASSNISGVTVNLYTSDGTTPAKNAYGITISSVNTNSSGLYYFNDLGEGEYIVKFTTPSGYDAVTIKESTGAAVDKNSDADRNTRKTDEIKLIAGQRNLTIDAGFYKFSSIGNYVFNDRNFNNKQDDGDVPVSGVSVTLYVSAGGVTSPATYWNGTTVQSTTTNALGEYRFTGLDPGTYVVEFKVSNGDPVFVPYSKDPISIDDSNIVTSSGGTGWTNDVVLASGTTNDTIDAGLRFGRIGDWVWHDENGNGIQDGGEAGIDEVTVKLYMSSGGVLNEAVDAFGLSVAAVTTTKGGFYYFNDLGAGDYVVKFITPAGYNITKKNATTSALDSDADRQTGLSSVITLVAGAQDITVDCGLYMFASIGDLVFNDLNSNGIQNTSEGGITGVAVTLYRVTTGGVTIPATYWDGSGYESVPLQITTGSGVYKFTGLDPGDYMVQFKTTDSAFRATYPNEGSDDTKDSDGITTTTNYSITLTNAYTLGSGEYDQTVDQGFFEMKPGIMIEKTVYEGAYSPTKSGTNLIGRVSGQALTYIFEITNTGNTYLSEIEVGDVELGITLGGMTTVSGVTLLSPGAKLKAYYQTTFTIDILNTAVTTGTAVYDATGTAIPGMAKPTDSDTAEARKVDPGITIEKTVYSGHTSGGGAGLELLVGTVGEKITYLFKVTNTGDTFLQDITIVDKNISKGGVYLTNGGMTLLSGSATSPLATGASLIYYYETTLTGDLENRVVVTGTACNALGQKYDTAAPLTAVDTAKVEIQSSIGDTVWYNYNSDSSKDVGEPGVSGVAVHLSSGGVIIRSTTTNADGYYLFDKLTKGAYEVIVEPGTILQGYKQNYSLDGTLNNRTTKTIGTSEAALDVDFGYEPIPHLKFTKTVNPTNSKRGQTITYTLTVLNDGKTDLEDIRISDAAVGINITIATLVSKASITTDVAFNLPSTFVGPWINIAEAWSSTTAIVTAQAITNVSPPSSPPPPVIPPVIPPVVPPIGPGGGTVDTEKDTPTGGTVPGTGGTVVTPPGDGTVTVEDGKWTYTPDPGFVGTDSFVIVTIDDDGIPISFEITVNVLEKDNLHLPKTGGVDQGLLYGTGFLLMLLGLMLLRTRSYSESRGRRKRA
ncbi:MAG: SdrD B-like domain-containing protein [Anaerovoracaceae bacterium]|jgi:uncharacterized repeat protein (TIGR01451 family)|nr:SdrD B-like domain-containing protein [Anaerovoracaceae bacterium]